MRKESDLKWFFRILKENFKYLKGDSVDVNESSSNGMSVMSFNIRRDSNSDGDNNWQYRRDAIIEMIIDKSPDIICFQEVMPHMAKFIVSHLSNDYDNCGLEAFTGKNISKSFCVFGEGLLTLYKKKRFTKVSEEKIKLFDGRIVNFRRAWAVGLYDKYNKKTIEVINTHFCHISAECHVKSFNKLYNRYINNKSYFDNVYMCGDFNCELNWINSGTEILTKKFFSNPITKKGSINSFRDNRSPATIDYVFSTNQHSNTEVLYDGYGVKFLSDHYPVLCYYNN